MSDKFNGFSQDEINKVTATKKAAAATATEATMKTAFRGQHNGIRRMPEKWSTKTTSSTQTVTKQTKPAKHNPNAPNASDVGSKIALAAPSQLAVGATAPTTAPNKDDLLTEVIDLDDSMSKSIEEALFYQPLRKHTVPATAAQPINTNAALSTNTADDSSILKLPTMDSNVTSTSESTNSLDDSSILPTPRGAPVAAAVPLSTVNTDSPFKGISLKDFESHRKMIEEQNKQKKELLYKAIEHHSQKTAAETRKIEEIKCELAKLDNDLAVDVAILRKQIDNACIHFANIEKQYIKIEAQFLKAKIDLHNAAEKKELLTEHLCTVIAHNEDRKAQKLSELMQKVGITPAGDYELPATNTNECQL